MRNEVPSEGRWISAEDVAERRRVVFLGARLKKKLFSGEPAVDETVRINGVRFTVIGTMDMKFSDSCYFNCDDESAFIPYTAAADIWDARYASVMVFEPVAPQFEAQAMQQFRTAVANRQHFSPNDKRAITMFGRQEFKPIYDGITLGNRRAAVLDRRNDAGNRRRRRDEYHAGVGGGAGARNRPAAGAGRTKMAYPLAISDGSAGADVGSGSDWNAHFVVLDVAIGTLPFLGPAYEDD